MKNRLEELRRQRGIKQEELASVLEVSRQTIGSLENGRYIPSILLALLRAETWIIAMVFLLFLFHGCSASLSTVCWKRECEKKENGSQSAEPATRETWKGSLSRKGDCQWGKRSNVTNIERAAMLPIFPRFGYPVGPGILLVGESPCICLASLQFIYCQNHPFIVQWNQ